MRIYFDNAATTPIAPQVIEVMTDMMKNNFGNPSSIHHFGRIVRAAIENARRKISNYLNSSPSELFFTSSGTEANNMAITGAIRDYGIRHVITSPTEHHAVLNVLQQFEKQGLIQISWLNVDERGKVDLEDLERHLKNPQRSLVSLMHANNEIATLLSIKEVSRLCRTHNAIFHSDMVQTMGKYRIDLQAIDVDFATCSGHKFHGAKGTGFIYINATKIKINPFIFGGAQERNMRGGTENSYGIVGLAKAFEMAHENMEADIQKIKGLKAYMVEQLEQNIQGIEFLGESRERGLHTIVNVLFPKTEFSEMLVQNLDIEGIAVSSGSACSSGTVGNSHVLEAIGCDLERPAIRFSFSKYNTTDEIDFCIQVLKKYFP